jgi:hypothetical protein
MQPPSQQDPAQILSGMVQQPSQQIIIGAPSTNATAALVLSILGIVGSFFYGLGIFCAIPGLILANGALRITNQFPNHPDAGMAKAAKVCAWVGIGLSIALILLVVVAGVLYVWAASLAEA